jgi:hypothetical protein
MNTFSSFRIFVPLGALLPGIVYAAPGTFAELMDMIIAIVDIAVPVIIAAAVAAFFFGLTKTLLSAGDTDALKEGRTIMTFGIIALFIIVGLWGILGIVHRSIFDTEANPPVDSHIPEDIYGGMAY